MDRADVFARGVGAANVLLRYYGIDVRKALDPLNERDFDVIIFRLGKDLNKAGLPEEVALRKAIDQLDVDWATLTPAGRNRIIDAAQRTVAGSVTKVLPRANNVLEVESKMIVGETRKSVKRTYDFNIATQTTALDKRIADFAATSQSNFITNSLGDRSEVFSAQARGIVANGLEQGLGRDDIAERMEKKLLPDSLARKRSYWPVVSGSFSNRARTFGQLSSYTDAGISQYVFESVLDEATTDVCRFMHGKRFSVSSGLSKLTEVEELEDPAAVKDSQPWARTRVLDGGGQEIQYKSGGQSFRVATIDRSAVGRSNAIGSFSNGLSGSQLQSAGITMPPLHGLCRSTVVPEI